MLVISIILINVALIIYTISIWNERKCKKLYSWHAIMFSVGLVCDIIGTFIMYGIAGNKIGMSIHDVLGYIALFLMVCNTVGAIFILFKKQEKLIAEFYKFGIFAWSIWVVSYVVGMVVNIRF